MASLTVERLRELLTYDPATGEFRWRATRPPVVKGERAGAISARYGYRIITLDYRPYRAARLAVLYVAGAWPVSSADHRNMKRDDDRWGNLRAATTAQNHWNRGTNRNSKTGIKSVFRWKNGRGYYAQISANGVRKYLGTFKTAEEAQGAWRRAAAKMHGEFMRETR